MLLLVTKKLQKEVEFYQLLKQKNMDIAVYTSKKGTKVVTAMDIHQALDLGAHHYGVNVRRWLKDVFQFNDGIRRPIVNKDYAPRKQKEGQLLEDYFLSLELAKLIVLQSRSKFKMKYARILSEMESAEGNNAPISKAEMQDLLELVKAMSLQSNQEKAERQHLELYTSRNGDSTGNWWPFRANLLNYSAEDLRMKMEAKGLNPKNKTQRQMLQVLDPAEAIRTGVIDYYMAQGKTAVFARNLGDVAKLLAEKLQLGVFEDRLAGNMFAPEFNAAVLRPVLPMVRERA
jgi:hypothetical protein